MAGVKGRSGRRPLRDEEKRLKIIDKAWDLISIKLDSNDADRFAIARDIVIKDVPSEIKGKGFAGDKRIIIIRPSVEDSNNRIGSEVRDTPETGSVSTI